MKTERDLRKVLREIRKIDGTLAAQLSPQDIAKLKQERKDLKKQAEDILDELLAGDEQLPGEDYQKLLDEAKTLTSRIQRLDALITTKKILYIENVEVVLTDTQLQPFIDKRAEIDTRLNEICDLVRAL